jgi:hypothetical protein
MARVRGSGTKIAVAGKILATHRSRGEAREAFMRFCISIVVFGLAIGTSFAQDAQSILLDLDVAKKRYAAGMAQFKQDVMSQFDAREEKIRGAKNGLALLKVHALEKEYFEDGGDLPLWMPTSVYAARERHVRDLDAAYQTAIRSLTKAKQDRAAEKVQGELQTIWEKRFDKIDYKAASIKDGVIRIPTNTAIWTLEEYSGPIEVFAVARTRKYNIRLAAYPKSGLIVNWEGNPKELRVYWPGERDTLSSANTTPLKPDTFYQIRWLIGPGGMTVYLNDQKVFSESRSLGVDKMKSKVNIHSVDDELEVKEFRVRRLVVEQ